MIIRSRAPVRVSFGGGGTDIPPVCDERGGCVISAAINKYAYATMIKREDREIHIESADFLKNLRFGRLDEISYNNELDLLKAVIKKMNLDGMGCSVFMRSDVPPKSGLGSSASAFAAVIGLFNHMRKEKKMTDYEVSELAYKLEREELKIGGGKQDQYATVFGGMNYIEFGNGWVRVNPLRMKKDHVFELEKQLVLVYTKPRETESSGDIISDQTRAYKEKNTSVIDAFDKIKEIAQEMRYALLRGDLNRFGLLLDDAWKTKKKFSPMISNNYINDMYDAAIKAGALGGKITGAGGGGFMLFYCEPNKEHLVREKLQSLGAKAYPFTIDWNGLQTWEVD
ncbi:GHMP kinase [Candidatus Aenigmatarchaeota archaeon]